MNPAITSLTKEQGIRILREYGLDALLKVCEMRAHLSDNRANKQKEKTFKDIQDAIPQMLKLVEAKQITTIQNAFNSAPAFIACFQAAVVGAMPLLILHGIEAINRVGAALEGIQSELEVMNVMKVQGWGEDGFAGHVHRFVRKEMTCAARDRMQSEAPETPYYFYVWHTDTSWYVRFEEIQRKDALGTAFGGYHCDLATICLRMRSDREALLKTTAYGRSAVFHLLIPAYERLVVDSSVAFHWALRPLVVVGEKHKGVDFVWVSLYASVDSERRLFTPTLRHIGNLPYPRDINGAAGVAQIAFGCVQVAAVAVGGPFAAPLFLCAWAGNASAVGAMVAGGMYKKSVMNSIQILGDAMFLGEESQANTLLSVGDR